MQTESNDAHGKGFTCLTFSRDGIRAFTGGDDCIVRIWKVEDGSEQEPATATEAEQGITSIAVADDCWISGSLDGSVRRYLKDSSKLDGVITELNCVAVRCVAIDPRHKTVAVASEFVTLPFLSSSLLKHINSEPEVILIELDDTLNIRRLKGHRGGVRKATWHPTAALLTTCGSDGQIIVWDVSGNEPKPEVIPNIIPTVKDTTLSEFFHDCSAVWHPSGDYFFVASRSRDFVRIKRSDWKKAESFFDRDNLGAVTALAISPNGAYLASAVSSMIHIWSIDTSRIIARHSSGTAYITQLAFSPTENLLAWTTEAGTFARWPKPIADAYHDPVKPILAVPKAAGAETKASAIFDDEGAVEVELNIENEVEEDGDDVADDGSEAEWINQDTETGPALAPSDFVKEMVSITKAQPPFQPGATPMLQTKRLLGTNGLGYIEVTTPPDTDHHLVDVKFFDQSKGKVSFKDEFKYNLGVLGERGALFACRPQNGQPALVHYRPYVKDTSAHWTYKLPQDCTVLGIAAGGLPMSGGTKDVADLDGSGNIVIATSHADLTFLSGTGRERRIMGLGSDFISMVAGREWVFVVHRAGSTTIDGSQNLSYTLINFDDFSVRQRDFLPIPKGHTLKWIGITAEGAPAMYDSTERIHVLTKHRIPHHASWARILDANLLERRTGKDESYWPFAISGSQLLCFILKGTQTYPIHPIPPHSELPIEMPFRSENKVEERFERDVLMVEILRDGLDDELTSAEISKAEQRMDKDLLLLIQSACQSINIPRAIELAKLVHNPRTLDLLVKMADFFRLEGLKEKFQKLKEIRAEEEDRLVIAREKRRQWTRPDPLPRLMSAITEADASLPNPFQDFGPPPTMSRPGLTPAVPIRETTRYTTKANVDMPPTPVASSSDSPPENKRKRDEAEDISSSFDFAVPPPKQKTNPFARKVVPENGRNNLFARKADLKTLQKSESFFDKVDAAEDTPPKTKRTTVSKAKEKEKEKKDGPKQITLFGMMSSAPRTQKSRLGEAQPADSDVTMTDASLVETQLVETQPDLPDEWEETQPVDETTFEETQA
ncbi:hypothetical protein C8R45DRAFT_1211105 [Mycena sanguinolenta]|nr:hypothetical protein C8R45DRAFT_1211105 [Mycena sanguinolenta]